MRIRSTHDVGSIVKGRRLALGLSQQDLASKASVSRKWISDLESGKPRAELQLVLAVFEVLGLSLDAATVGDIADD